MIYIIKTESSGTFKIDTLKGQWERIYQVKENDAFLHSQTGQYTNFEVPRKGQSLIMFVPPFHGSSEVRVVRSSPVTEVTTEGELEAASENQAHVD